MEKKFLPGDFYIIHFTFLGVLIIEIYNRDGIRITEIGNTISLGQKGIFIWDGIAHGQYVSNGIYILRFSLFDDKGLIKHYKIPFGIHN